MDSRKLEKIIIPPNQPTLLESAINNLITRDRNFHARNVFLTVTWKKCIITFIHAVKTHIYAGGRKPLIWLRPPPSAPSLKTACVKSNAGAWALQRRWRGEISRPRQVEIARPHFHEPALPPKSSERICWPINFTLRGMDWQTPGLQFACQPFEANR